MITRVKIAAIAILGLVATDSVWAQQSKKKAAAHNSKNSLDWAGKYSNGVVELNLFEDNSYYYKNGNLYTSGNFKWAGNGNSITLLGTNEQYKVQEEKLVNIGNEVNFYKNGVGLITGSKSKISMDEQLLGGKWILIELYGKKITEDADNKKHPYLAFENAEGTFSGNGGCNGFGGSMKVADNLKIEFGDAIQTMMACLGGDVMETETKLHQALKNADNYTIKDGILSLNKARMAPLARFKFVAN